MIGLVNAVGSSIAREVDGGVYLHAGPEVCGRRRPRRSPTWRSAFAMLALHLGRMRDLSPADGRRIIEGLRRLPEQIEEILGAGGGAGEDRRRARRAREHVLRRPGPRLPGGPRGRAEAEGDLLPARRGVPDLGAQARAARADRPACRVWRSSRTTNCSTATSARCTRSAPAAARSWSSPTRASTRRARRRQIVVPKNEPELDPILLTIPLQILAYHAAVALGHDIDKPRNLAKSVTVDDGVALDLPGSHRPGWRSRWTDRSGSGGRTRRSGWRAR